ncbi:MAG: hypothetical protein HY238_08050 [Acidobacteria bacterium]|nr:hypothetical protein [Acidobacteriota bacterium]
MSLTEVEHIFAGVHEAGINDFLQAFFTARPRHLNYGTSLFVPVTTAAATNMATIPFPGIPGGIHWAVSFTIPTVDLFPDSSGGTAPLIPGPGQFSVKTRVTLTVGCGTWNNGDNVPGTFPGPPPSFTPLTTTLDVFALGHLTSVYFGPGNGRIGLRVDSVEIVNITPDTLESVVECIIRMILDAVAQTINLPFNALTIGFVSLILLRGPEIEDDQVKLYGDV